MQEGFAQGIVVNPHKAHLVSCMFLVLSKHVSSFCSLMQAEIRVCNYWKLLLCWMSCCVTNCHSFSGWTQHRHLTSVSVGQKSKDSLTGSLLRPLRCWSVPGSHLRLKVLLQAHWLLKELSSLWLWDWGPRLLKATHHSLLHSYFYNKPVFLFRPMEESVCCCL